MTALPTSRSEPAKPHEAPEVRVCFDETEQVSPFGTVRTTYRVLWDRVWLSPNRLPHATQTMCPTRPGILWLRHVEVLLPLGTRVERITNSPERGTANAAAILMGKARGLSQRTKTLTLKVGPKGVLLPE